MLKYQTFEELLKDEDLLKDSWFHLVPKMEMKLLHELWVQDSTTAMADYSSWQSKRNFSKAKRIFMLMPLDGKERYLFVGAYDVLTDDRPRKEGPDGQMYFFVANQFNPNILSDSVARLIVQWELPTRSRYRKAETAAQHLKLAAFREHPFGQADLLFPGYQEFHWSFDELVRHSKAPLAAWKSALSKVAGIYAITDEEAKTTYLGSAYGQEGIWGRWMEYAKTKHGDNTLLKDHIHEHGTKGLVFSVLLTMDQGSLAEEVIGKEAFFKRALGTRVFGLNAN